MWRHLLDFWVCSLSKSYSLASLWRTVTFSSWKLSFELASIISVSHYKLQTESKSEFVSRHSLLYIHCCFWNKVPWWSTGSGVDFASPYAFLQLCGSQTAFSTERCIAEIYRIWIINHWQSSATPRNSRWSPFRLKMWFMKYDWKSIPTELAVSSAASRNLRGQSHVGDLNTLRWFCSLLFSSLCW